MSAEPAAAPPEAQLEWEAGKGKLAAAAAFLSAALAAASTAVQASVGAPPESDRGKLQQFNDHESELFLGLGLQLASYVLLAGALLYLLRATRHRHPEVPRFAPGLLLLAPLLLGIAGLFNQLDYKSIADEFVTSGSRGEARAKDLLEDRSPVGSAFGLGGTLCLALSFVLISLNAMRAGLLSRFMGVLGVVVGALLVLPLLPGAIVQIFWVAALGLLFLGRWPGGRGPAWETGQPVPWPSAADARAERLSEEPSTAGDHEAPADPQPVARKRSRKKKRR